METTIDRELRDVLIAISVVSRRLADKYEKRKGEASYVKCAGCNVNCQRA